MDGAIMTYKHEVLEKASKELVRVPVLNEDEAREFLDELVADWDQAKAASICEECGLPVVDGEPYVVDEEDGGSIGHAECILQRGPGDEDRRDDSGYWMEQD
ncbi:hypothetical protein PBI_DEWDROP_89 [Microbacterium phage Dewdrop]|nr:hypothetical protein PBI_LEAF_89 [Microbacterium phage Leaf]QGZ17457.1 hypothetical protein PBI_DEWDROP_89 [Microbacterium phage Dewdrop]